MGSGGLLIIGTAIHEGTAAIRVTCFQNTVIHLTQQGAFLHSGEGFCHLPCFRGVAGKGGRWVEGAHCITGSCLIPLAAICGCDGCMGGIRGIELTGVVQIHSGLTAIRHGGGGLDMSTTDLCAGELRTARHCSGCEVRHEVTNAAISNVAGNGAGHIVGPGSDGGNGCAVQGGAVTGRHTTKGTANKSDAATGAHPGAAIHNSIAHKTVGAVAGRKAGHEAASCTCGSACRGATCCGGEGGACAVAAAMAKPGDEPGGHQHLHAHTAACLSDRQTHRCQIAVCTLSNFQKGQRTEDP